MFELCINSCCCNKGNKEFVRDINIQLEEIRQKIDGFHVSLGGLLSLVDALELRVRQIEESGGNGGGGPVDLSGLQQRLTERRVISYWQAEAPEAVYESDILWYDTSLNVVHVSHSTIDGTEWSEAALENNVLYIRNERVDSNTVHGYYIWNGSELFRLVSFQQILERLNSMEQRCIGEAPADGKYYARRNNKWVDISEYLDIPEVFIPVSDITGIPASAAPGIGLLFNGSVIPVNATNRAIVWTVEDAGGTGAAVSGNMLSSTSEGVVRIRALITGGISAAEDFTKDFEITLAVPVYRVELGVNVQGWGSTTGGGNYRRGSVIEINAAAAAGYRFTEWRNADGSRYSLLATVEVAVYKNENLTAVFEPVATGGKYGVYWGKSANGALQDITVLGNYAETDTRARQLPFASTPDEQYYYYAYPAIWGAAVFTQGGGTIDSMILSTARVDGTDYYVYRSLYPGTAATVFNAE